MDKPDTAGVELHLRQLTADTSFKGLMLQPVKVGTRALLWG